MYILLIQDNPDTRVKNVSVLILNNLLSSTDPKINLKEFDIMGKLEKIACDEDEDYDVRGHAASIMTQFKKQNK